MSARSTRVTLEQAEQVVMEFAAQVKEACQVGKRDWACSDCGKRCDSQREHDRLLDLARRLRMLVKDFAKAPK